MAQYDLWPNSSFRIRSFGAFQRNISSIENDFADLYAPAQVVLFSSARAGLYNVLRLLNIRRQDAVWVPPFSSHCVFNTVSFLGTPTTDFDEDVHASIVYHQWGFEKRSAMWKGTTIEDSADSLLADSRSLFPNAGRFEVISLPKTLGSCFGGIIICKNDNDATALRELRHSALGFGLQHHLLKLIGRKSKRAFHYWDNSEPLNGGLSWFLLDDVKRSMDSFDKVLQDRKVKVDLMAPFSVQAVNVDKGRFPCVIPIAWDARSQESAAAVGVNLGMRHMVCYGEEQVSIRQVLPIPIHQQIPVVDIKALAHSLEHWAKI